MSEGRVRAAIGALVLVGAAVAGYLTYVRATGSTLACTTGGCATVQSSSYAEVLGIPVATLGLVGYLLIGASVLARGDLARAATVTLALGALGFSAWLLYVQLAVIDAVCDWCLANDAIVAAIAVLALLRFRAGYRAPPADA